MISPLQTFVLLLAVIPLLWPSLALASSDKEFQSLIDTHWANSVKEKIYFRNDPDAWRMDGTLSEHTANARARRNSFNELMLEQLGNIDKALLILEDAILAAKKGNFKSLGTINQ